MKLLIFVVSFVILAGYLVHKYDIPYIDSQNELKISPKYNKKFNDLNSFSDFYKIALTRQLAQRETEIENGILAKFPPDTGHVLIIDCAWNVLRYEISRSDCDPMNNNFNKCFDDFHGQSFQCSTKRALNYCGRLYTSVGYYAKEVETGKTGCAHEN